jgi:hypothetical protein
MTAEEFEQENAERFDSYSEMMVSFARMHVENALDIASESAEIKKEFIHCIGEVYEIDKDSILNAYPLTNIK